MPDMDVDRNAAAAAIVRGYVEAHLDKSDPAVAFDVHVVWQCHVLGNAKWLLSTTLPDGMYYEVTYDAAKARYYLDAYKKFENACIDEAPPPPPVSGGLVSGADGGPADA